jgi:hypothetical protein
LNVGVYRGWGDDLFCVAPQNYKVSVPKKTMAKMQDGYLRKKTGDTENMVLCLQKH